MVKRVVVLCALSLLSGCGSGSSTSRVEVSGRILMDGQPLGGAEVTLFSDKNSGYGRTDAEGHFTLVRGIDPGDYKVVVSKMTEAAPVLVASAANEGLDAGQLQAIALATLNDTTRRIPNRPALPKQLIPANYSNPETTQLSLEITENGLKGTEFNLTSK